MQSVTLSSFSAPGSHQLVFIVYFIVYLVGLLVFRSCIRVAVCLTDIFSYTPSLYATLVIIEIIVIANIKFLSASLILSTEFQFLRERSVTSDGLSRCMNV